MALRSFINEIRTLKIRDVPGYVKPMLSVNYAKNTIKRGLDHYGDKYIETGSAEPIFHVCFGGMIFFYLINLPEEHRHLRAMKEAQLHGGGGHH